MHPPTVTAEEQVNVALGVDADRRIAVRIAAKTMFRGPHGCRPRAGLDVVDRYDRPAVAVLVGAEDLASFLDGMWRDVVLVERLVRLAAAKAFRDPGRAPRPPAGLPLQFIAWNTFSAQKGPVKGETPPTPSGAGERTTQLSLGAASQ